MAFWSCVLKNGSKPGVYVPSGDPILLHISQASVPATVKDGVRVSVVLKQSADEQGTIICTLKAGTTDTVPLDLFIDHYTEFSLITSDKSGALEVHLSGYFSPDETPGMMDDDDEDDEYEAEGEDMDMDHPLALGLGDDEDDEDEDEDGEMGEDEEDEDEDADEDREPGVTRRPHVTIEEIKEEKAEQKKGKNAKAAQPAANGAAKRAAEPEEQPSGKKMKQEQQQQKTPAKQEQKGKQEAAKTPATAGKQDVAKTPATAGKQQEQKSPATTPTAKEIKSTKKNIRTWENGLTIEDVAMGAPNGKLAKGGKKVTVRYVGKLKSNGKIFDQTKGGKGFSFRLGTGEVIKGWDIGVEGMRVGDKRKLTIPPQLAYGSSGVRGAIPPNATLEFDVELVDVK